MNRFMSFSGTFYRNDDLLCGIGSMTTVVQTAIHFVVRVVVVVVVVSFFF